MTTIEKISTKKAGKTIKVTVYTKEELEQEIRKLNHKTRIHRFYTKDDKGKIVCKEYLPRDDGSLRLSETTPKTPWVFLRVVKEILSCPTLRQDISIYKNTETDAERRYHRIFILKDGSPTLTNPKGEAIPNRKYELPDGADIIL